MKVKKELKKANDRINEQILEEGKNVYDKILSENAFVEEEKSSGNIFGRKKLVWIYAMCSVLVLIISLSIILPFILKDDAYLGVKDYQKSANISIEDINSEFTAFQINNVDFRCECSKVYDKKNNDTLYYQINLYSLDYQSIGKLYIKVNENYVFNEKFSGEKITETYKNHLLSYTMAVVDANMNCFGLLEIESTKIYFEFSGGAEVFTTPIPFLDQALIIE